jgi:putative transposase
MSEFRSLAHSRFDCKYHIVFVPKCRRKVLYGKIREFLIPKFKELATQKGCKNIKGNMVQDHVHLLVEIPPKYAVR